MKLDLEKISFEIIGKVGEAKNNAMMAFKIAKKATKLTDLKEARSLVNEANKNIEDAGKIHMDVIVEEANGNDVPFKVLFMHAEDQFLSTQTFVLVTSMLIDVLEKQYDQK